MAGPVQMLITDFWSQLQKLEAGIKSLQSELNADRTQLMQLWDQTKTDPDRTRAAANQALLTPQIHHNSELRVMYQDIANKFNQTVQAASDALKTAGYSTPQLGGLGLVIAVAPLAAVTLLGLAFAALAIAVVLTQAQRTATAAIAKVMTDPTLTVEQKKSLLAAGADAQKKAGDATGHPLLPDLGPLVPILGLVALILLGPQLLKMVPGRRAAA